MANYDIPTDSKYDPLIRKLEDTDPASASETFNPLFQKMIGNTHAVYKLAEKLAVAATIISPTEPTEHCEIWLKPMGQADTPDDTDDPKNPEETPPPNQSLFYFLAHCYDKKNKSFVPFMYMNAAQNVFMTPGGTETVADAISQLQSSKSTNDYTDADKAKLSGIAANANNYTHPTGDGNSHIPSTGTSNSGKVLKAGSTANSTAWGSVSFSEIASKPTTVAGYGITDGKSPNIRYDNTVFSDFMAGFTNPVSREVFDGVYTDGPAHGQGTNAFVGGVLAPDGKVILVPYNSPNVGIYDLMGVTVGLGYCLHPYLNKF